MSNPVPEKLINFRVYLEGVFDMLGLSDVELPSFESMTDTVSGAGVAGEVDAPILGHFGAMSLTLNWRTVTQNAMLLAQQRAHPLDLRGSIQQYDASAGQYKTVPLQVLCSAHPKNIGLGSLQVGSSQENTTELEITRISVLVDNVSNIVLDKFNYICVINGVDYLAQVRENLGL